ncbi:MAG TPA: riboflavin synthase [Candidatus Dormibacteraeota bacterium]|nr:riboflavin synthase [Candidatus Dormibacteraeota bacterium]
MFTGIIEETGRVLSVTARRRAIRLIIEATKAAQGLRPGDSLSVNGACLTVVSVTRPSRRGGAKLDFDLLGETWDRTNLQFTSPGSLVNLERPLRADGRLDGHFVTGHVDGVGRITRWQRSGSDQVLEIAAPALIRRYLIEKGSIAVDGISLTVAALIPRGFRIWIIPHTLEVTCLRERQVGDAVNLEGDILGKFVEKLMRRLPRRSTGTR